MKDQGRDQDRSLRRLIVAGLDLVFPPRCAGCGTAGWDWCPSCERALDRLKKPHCRICGTPHSIPVDQCSQCDFFPLGLRVRSYAWYRGPLMHAILQLKYRPNRKLANIMAGWLAPLYRQANGAAGVICAVPLGKKRFRERGYNQAELIAAGLAEMLDLPESTGLLNRTRETRSQVGLDPHARQENVEGAFQAGAKVQDQRIVLVDDLYTTGATLAACCAALRKAGARDVLALTVARA